MSNLAVKDSSQLLQLKHNLTVHLVNQARIIVSFEGINPADVSHGRVISFHVKLVLEADGKAMEWANWAVICGKVFVKLLGSLQRLIEEDFVQTIVLRDNEVTELGFNYDIETDTLRPAVTHNLMGNCGRLAKGLCNLQSTASTLAKACHQRETVLSDYINLSGTEILLDKWPGQVSLSGSLFQICRLQQPVFRDLSQRA